MYEQFMLLEGSELAKSAHFFLWSHYSKQTNKQTNSTGMCGMGLTEHKTVPLVFSDGSAM